MRTVPYLTFAGNAREAMIFYQKCLGGKLKFQKLGDSPLGKSMNVKMKNTILHASLVKRDLVIFASDMVGENGLSKGNSVSLMLNYESEKEMRTIYKKLSRGGKQTHQIETTFFGSFLGDLTDKYGINWILHYKKAKTAETSSVFRKGKRRGSTELKKNSRNSAKRGARSAVKKNKTKKQKYENNQDHLLDNYEYHLPF
jgi:PhnB protein